MKKLSASTLFLFALAAVMVVGCKSKQKLPKGETEINIPCSGPDFFTNNKFFRANSLGESMDLVASKKKALSNARGELASSIETTVKAVTDNYLNSREMNNKEEVEERFEQIGNEVDRDQDAQSFRRQSHRQIERRLHEEPATGNARNRERQHHTADPEHDEARSAQIDAVELRHQYGA